VNGNFSSNSNYSGPQNDFQPSEYRPVSQTAPSFDFTPTHQHDFIPDAEPEFKAPGHDKRMKESDYNFNQQSPYSHLYEKDEQGFGKDE